MKGKDTHKRGNKGLYLILISTLLLTYIKKLLDKKGYTQISLSKKLGVSQQTVSNWLHGRLMSINEDIYDKLVALITEVFGFYPGTKEYYTTHHPSVYPSSRRGPAHMMVGRVLICGEPSGSVRYYRNHEQFLNQKEICPKCLQLWQESQDKWNGNQGNISK